MFLSLLLHSTQWSSLSFPLELGIAMVLGVTNKMYLEAIFHPHTRAFIVENVACHGGPWWASVILILLTAMMWNKAPLPQWPRGENNVSSSKTLWFYVTEMWDYLLPQHALAFFLFFLFSSIFQHFTLKKSHKLNFKQHTQMYPLFIFCVSNLQSS